MAASSHHHFPKEKTLTASGVRWRELNKKVEIQTSKTMKTKMKRQGSTELPRFAVGALAIAGASAANATTVQITFANNYVSSSTGLTNLVADLTGDGVSDVAGVVGSNEAIIGVRTGSGFVQAFAGGYQGRRGSSIRKVGSFGFFGEGTNRGLASVVFTDARINGGARSQGWADVTGTAAPGAYLGQIHRLIFNDASTTYPTGVTSATTGLSEWSAPAAAVPEPSSLGLLALGAGGLLARRRRVG